MNAGSLIHGTHRPEDLFPAFLAAAQAANPSIVMEDETIMYGYAKARKGLWESEQVAYAIERLFDVLDDMSPAGYFFGAHPGDGSDFGWWPIED